MSEDPKKNNIQIKKKKHLIPDETIEFKFGMQPDDQSENDSDEPIRKKNSSPKPRRDPSERRRRRRTFIIIGIVAACAIGVILWLAIPNSGKNYYDNNMSGIPQETIEAHEGFPLSISGTTVSGGNFHAVEKELVYVSDTSVVRLNQKAGEVYNRSHSFYHPIVRSGGDYTMVYNVGSAGYRVDNKRETVHNETTEDVIMAGDVAENGKYAVVTETKGYPSYLTVYMADGSPQYTYRFANCYVIDVALNEDGSVAAVAGLSASEGEMVSELYLLDTHQEEPVAVAQFENTMLMAVDYCDGRALAVGDNLVASLDGGGSKQQYEYGSRKISAYTFEGDRALVALSPYDSSTASRLEVLNSKAEEIAGQDYDGVVTAVSLYGDTMAAFCNGKIHAFSVNAVRNFHGKEGERQSAFKEMEADNDTRAIALADESSLYILGISSIGFEDF